MYSVIKRQERKRKDPSQKKKKKIKNPDSTNNDKERLSDDCDRQKVVLPTKAVHNGERFCE